MIDWTLVIPELRADWELVQAKLPYRYVPYMGYRSAGEQDALFKAWQAGKGGRAAPAWESAHNFGLAIDVEPIVDGHGSWEPEHYKPLVDVLADHPTLRSGASFSDSPHIEWRYPLGPWTRGSLALLPHVGQSELITRVWPLVRIMIQRVQTGGSILGGGIQEDGGQS